MRKVLIALAAYWTLLAPGRLAVAQIPPTAGDDSVSAGGHPRPARAAVPESASEPGASLALERDQRTDTESYLFVPMLLTSVVEPVPAV